MNELWRMLFADAATQKWSWMKVIVWIVAIIATVIVSIATYGCAPTAGSTVLKGKIVRQDSLLYEQRWERNSSDVKGIKIN